MPFNDAGAHIPATLFPFKNEHYYQLVLSGKFSDVTIECGDKIWRAHKLVLVNSPTFAKMLDSDNESDTHQTTNMMMPDEEPEVVDILIKSVYLSWSKDFHSALSFMSNEWVMNQPDPYRSEYPLVELHHFAMEHDETDLAGCALAHLEDFVAKALISCLPSMKDKVGNLIDHVFHNSADAQYSCLRMPIARILFPVSSELHDEEWLQWMTGNPGYDLDYIFDLVRAEDYAETYEDTTD